MRVLFLWHMHQPAYFINDGGKRRYLLPWVIQHALKEYYEMPYFVSIFDKVKVTFNLTPILVEQLLDYADGRADCKFTNLALKPAEDLTEDEIKFILYHFFNLSERTRIKPYQRFYYLFRKRGDIHELESRWKYFSIQDLRDLKFYWLFSAISPILVQKNPVLKDLASKREKYSDEDVVVLYNEMLPMIKDTLNLYKKLREEGRIEISATPYYHPILPVLVNSKNAEVSNPYTRRPDFQISFPENAEAHVKKAKSFIYEKFGFEITGMWPAEGSVSLDTVPIYKKFGIRWIASDEGILFKTLGRIDRELIYNVYDVEGLKIFFRDRNLSDKIGFEYTRKGEVESALDLFENLRDLSKKEDRVVPIILDGENPWDNYPNGGHKFLETLYSMLNSCTRMTTATFSEVAEEDGIKLYNLHPGSWIRSDFTTWVGHPEKNTAWKYLLSVKEMLRDCKDPLANEELMCAEGSDWFWWYGDDNFTIYYKEFDELFRLHLKKALEYASKEIPSFIEEPIKKEMQYVSPQVPTVSFINPNIDGRIDNYFEYLGSGEFDLSSYSTGQMVGKSYFLEKLTFGFNEEYLYLMVKPLPERKIDAIEFNFASGFRLNLELKERSGDKEGVKFAFDKVLELAIPLKLLGEIEEFKFFIKVTGEGVKERYPRVGSFKINKLNKMDTEILW